MTATTDTSGFHFFDGKPTNIFLSPLTIIAVLVAILLGIFTGYYFSPKKSAGVLNNTSGTQTNAVTAGQIVGSNDTSTFKDTAEGTLQTGGIGGEGQYHLVRPGGDSQNVYLTSSSVDLSQFLKHKVKVWGATQKAQTAGWLMDVGRIEVLQ